MPPRAATTKKLRRSRTGEFTGFLVTKEPIVIESPSRFAGITGDRECCAPALTRRAKGNVREVLSDRQHHSKISPDKALDQRSAYGRKGEAGHSRPGNSKV